MQHRLVELDAAAVDAPLEDTKKWRTLALAHHLAQAFVRDNAQRQPSNATLPTPPPDQAFTLSAHQLLKPAPL